MTHSRRQALLQGLFGAGLVGLRSLATGLPLSFFLDPRRALADAGAGVDAAANPYRPQYLIFSTSSSGDPVNANAPGTYNVPGVATANQPYHPSAQPGDPSFAPVSLTLGSTTTHAAAPWASLQPYGPCFFHHGTYTVVHPDEHSVLALDGQTKSGDMLVSLLASQLAPVLGTIQPQPVSVGAGGASETIRYQGAPQANLTPSSLRAILTAPGGPLEQLQSMRDSDLDALNAWARGNGNTAQKAFIDRYALSQSEARKISQTLLSNLAGIKGSSVADQLTAAIALIQMNVTPVVAIHVPFGGDNHSDPGFKNETQQTNSGIASIVSLQQQLAAGTLPDGTPLSDVVSFAMLNVFGRNLIPPAGPEGRGHLGDHHCSVLLGPGFKASVIGGVEPHTSDFRAQAIKVSNGTGVTQGDASAPSGSVAFSDTLAAMAMTLGRGLGVSPTFMSSSISTATPAGTAQPIAAALTKGA